MSWSHSFPSVIRVELCLDTVLTEQDSLLNVSQWERKISLIFFREILDFYVDVLVQDFCKLL